MVKAEETTPVVSCGTIITHRVGTEYLHPYFT